MAEPREGTRLAPKEDKRGTARRLAGFLLTGELPVNALGGLFTGGRVTDAYTRLSGPQRFVVDTLLSPVGLASLAFAPITGGGSVGLKAAAQAGVGALGKEVGKRAVGELAVGAAATKAGEFAQSLVPEDAPAAVQIGVPLAAGLVTGVGAASALTAGRREAARAARTQFDQELSQTVATFGTKHAVPLPDFAAAMNEVKTIPGDTVVGKIKRGLIGSTGINPSVLEETPVGIAHIAHLRAGEQIPHLVNLAMAKALPQGFSAFKFDKDLRVGNTGLVFNELFADPKAPVKYAFTPAQTETFKAYHELLDDVRALYRAAGIKHIDDAFMENGKLYVPRQVKESNGFVFESRSKSALERVWEDANEGAAHGVKYDNPVDALNLHLTAAYRRVAEKQFSDMVEQFALTPKQALLKDDRGRALYYGWEQAVKAKEKIASAVRLNERQMANLVARRSEAHATGRVRRVATLDKAIDTKRAERQALFLEESTAAKTSTDARNAYKALLTRTQNAEALPASFFGRGGEGMGERDLIDVAKWKGKFLPEDADYRRLRQWYNEHGVPIQEDIGRATGLATKVGDWLRFSTATFDVAMPLVQGMPLLAADPVAWGRMAVKHYQAFLNPDIQAGYLKKNWASLGDMITNGRVPIGDIERFNALRGGTQMRRIRGARGVQNFVAAYDMGLTVARHELWASLRPAWKGTPEELGQYVRNMTGGLELRGLGVGPSRRAVEGLVLFAPRLLRATTALVMDAARFWTPEGGQALQTLTRMAAGAGMVMMLANIWQGLHNGESYEDIVEKRLSVTMNPLEGKKFLSVQAENGEWYGPGGQVRSIAQFAARMMANPASALTADPRDNPLLSYAQGRLSPGASIGLGIAEAATGESLNILPFEYLDNPVALVDFIGTSILPFAVQSLMEGQTISGALVDLYKGESGPQVSPQLVLAGMMGARTSAQTPTEALNQIAQRKHGLPFGDLTGEQQAEIESDNPKIIEARKSYGDKIQREHQTRVEEINAEFQLTQKELVRGLVEGKFRSREEFRDAMEDANTRRFVARRSADKDFHVDFGPADSPKRKVLEAYYKTFEEAQLAPGQVDWLKWHELQAGLHDRILAGEFGDPEQMQAYIDERRRVPNAPEAQWFYDNEDTIDEAGYWDVRSLVFDRLQPLLASYGFEFRDVTELDRAIQQAATNGDSQTANLLMRFRQRIDAMAGREREIMRTNNPALDLALLENGWVEKPRSLEAMRAVRSPNV